MYIVLTIKDIVTARHHDFRRIRTIWNNEEKARIRSRKDDVELMFLTNGYIQCQSILGGIFIQVEEMLAQSDT